MEVKFVKLTTFAIYMLAKVHTSHRLFTAIMLSLLSILAMLHQTSSFKATSTLETLKLVASKERAYGSVLSMLKDAETGQRGFLLGSDETFLEPYNAGKDGLPAALEEIARLASSEEERQAARKISAFADAKLAEMAKAIALKKAGRGQEAIDVVASQQGKRLMDQLRKLVKEQLSGLEKSRVDLRGELTTTLQRNSDLGVVAFLASVVVIFAAVLLAANSLHGRSEVTKQAQLQAHANATQAKHANRRADHVLATALMLQAIESTRSPSELSRILPMFLQKLFPGTVGEVYLYKNSRDVLSLAAHWGTSSSDGGILWPSDCWALRLGKAHYSTTGKNVCCAHFRGGLTERNDVCIPLISQGEVIGLMVIAGVDRTEESVKHDEIVGLAEHLALAISNVQLRETLRLQSTIDSLTGLYNRRHFDEAFRRELLRAHRAGTSCSVVMIDLDHFKRLNDTYGHDAGDLVLKTTAQKVLSRVRASDIVCRLGGEELVLLLPECTAEAAAKCAESIRQTLNEIAIAHLNQNISGISASFGVASYPLHAIHGEELLKAADRALYVAKNNGRNRVVTAEPCDSLQFATAQIPIVASL